MRLVASWHGWQLFETAPGRYSAHGRTTFGLAGERDAVLTQFCARCKEEERKR